MNTKDYDWTGKPSFLYSELSDDEQRRRYGKRVRSFLFPHTNFTVTVVFVQKERLYDINALFLTSAGVMSDKCFVDDALNLAWDIDDQKLNLNSNHVDRDRDSDVDDEHDIQ